MNRRCVILGLVSGAVLSACAGGKRGSSEQLVAELPPRTTIAQVPLGDIAGAPEDMLRGTIANPFTGNAAAIQEGERFFHRMNCVACHGYGATGGMGPDLTDAAWRYGGTPVEIYKSIFEGRPKGMPAWGAMLPPEVMWKIGAYIQSLGGAISRREFLADIEGPAARSPKGKHVDE